MTESERSAAASVREALAARGLRQADIAPVLGISQPAVSERLTGKTPFTLADLDRLAAHLGLSVPELLVPAEQLVDEPEPTTDDPAVEP